MPDDVLTFWFDQTEPAQWWASDPAFDALIRRRYAALPAPQRRARPALDCRGNGLSGAIGRRLL